VIHDQVELPRVYEAWLTSPIFKPGDALADLASEHSRRRQIQPALQKLVYEKQIRARRQRIAEFSASSIRL